MSRAVLRSSPYLIYIVNVKHMHLITGDVAALKSLVEILFTKGTHQQPAIANLCRPMIVGSY
jgi:hypothetical protein